MEAIAGMWQLIKLYLKLFILKATPQNIPYSKSLLVVLIFLFLLISVPLHLFFSSILIANASPKINLVPLDIIQALFIVGVFLAIMLATVYSLLTCYNLKSRLVQILSSMLGVEIISAIILSFILFISPSVISIVLFIFLLYWQFMVHIHIFMHSFNIGVIIAGIFALIYNLLQHNVDELLLSAFMTVG